MQIHLKTLTFILGTLSISNLNALEPLTDVTEKIIKKNLEKICQTR